MNVWCPAKVVVSNAPLGPKSIRGLSASDSGYGSLDLSGYFKSIVGRERVEQVGDGMVPRAPIGALKGPRAYGGVNLGCEWRKALRGLGSVLEERKVYGPDLGRGLVAYGDMSDRFGMGRNGGRGMGWYCRNQGGYLT
ncbi:hypothetical protein HOY80DRAFT_1027908 [Tuber brumale]|nr:hypothetical protein HOY80DRAFT_1027908 [Tuber brumale]